VIENTLFPITIQRKRIADYRQRAKDLLKMVGLAGFEDRYPFELSGGMQQRASITRAIIHDPDILLMDEPFGALDALTRETMNVELQRIWMESKKTIFFITHSIPEAVFLGDRVILMSPRPGRIANVFEVSFPRPRPLEIMGALDFGEIANEIRAQLAS
jgi:NitT/TauT family transport system ATP-binding protein